MVPSQLLHVWALTTLKVSSRVGSSHEGTLNNVLPNLVQVFFLSAREKCCFFFSPCALWETKGLSIHIAVLHLFASFAFELFGLVKFLSHAHTYMHIHTHTEYVHHSQNKM